MGHFTFQRKPVFLAEAVKGKLHRKATIAAYLLRRITLILLTGCNEGFTSKLLVIKMCPADLHTDKGIFLNRVSFYRFDVSLKSTNEAVLLLNLRWEIFEQLIFQPEVLALIISAENFQSRNINI